MVEECSQDEYNTWLKKSEFETQSQFEKRTSFFNKDSLNQELQSYCLNKMKYDLLSFINLNRNSQLGEYDAETQTFTIKCNAIKDIVVNINNADAPFFKANFEKFDTKFELKINQEEKSIYVDRLTFSGINEDVFIYEKDKPTIKKSKNHNTVQVINSTSENNKPIKQEEIKINKTTEPILLSDVDSNIPISDQLSKNSKTFAFIIANENYQYTVPVNFAENDGKIFKSYLEKTLNVPIDNIKYFPNATFGNMMKAINLAKQIIEAYSGEASVIFYYAGHGIPNSTDKSSFLLPVDGTESEFMTSIKLEQMISKLTEYPSKQLIVILDACFSGGSRDDGMLAIARGVRIKPQQEPIKGNTVVFSATSNDESAYPYQEKTHGLFTYYLLKTLQESKGNATLGEIFNSVQIKVKQKALIMNNKPQTPEVISSVSVRENWKNWKLK